MSRLPDHLPPPAIKISVQRLECIACGAEANATCGCGVGYKPKGQLAAEAVAKAPEKSDRAIAAELGVGKDTVRRARTDQLAHHAPPQRVGRDGRRRRMPHPLAADTPEQIAKDAAADVEIERIVQAFLQLPVPRQQDRCWRRLNAVRR